MSRKYKAVVWRTGMIEIVTSVPDGAIEIARGGKKQLEECVLPPARLAYDGRTWLVPGIPEADFDDEAMAALKAFQMQVKIRLAKFGEGTLL